MRSEKVLSLEVKPHVLDQISVFYDRGQLTSAWKIAQEVGPLSDWKGIEAATWAGRLASNLGSRRLSHIIHWRAFKRFPHTEKTSAYWAHVILERYGPLRLMEFLETLPDTHSVSDSDSRIYLFTLRADAYKYFRDFSRAEKYLRQACQIQENNLWIKFSEADLLEAQDRYDEALDKALAALKTNPCYRPCIQKAAHLFQVLDRDSDALKLLREADVRMTCGPITGQLALLEMELGLFEESMHSFCRFIQLSPMADKSVLSWVKQNRISIACRMGNWDLARELSQEFKEPFYQKLLEHLNQPASPRHRIQLPVSFVRQHHLTCAPATLSALSRYWNLEAKHLEVAENICYDGTPTHSQRHWAETHGFAAREFTVTWEAAVQLLDRGIPFALATSEIVSGHMQAVIGYDQARHSLLIRDPFIYYTSEALCPQFLERYQSTGPHGLALVPSDKQELWENINLPDAPLYEELYRLNTALKEHRRSDAASILAAMENQHPQHRLTLTAGRTLAAYDNNSSSLLRYLEQLLKLYPDDGNLNLSKWSCLIEHASRQQRMEFLENICQKRHADPFFLVQWSQELRQDGREIQSAVALARRSLKYRPTDPDSLKAYADALWDVRHFENALNYYHLAACIAEKKEHFSQIYFIAAHSLKRTDECLEYLRHRVATLGNKSAQPVITLFDSLLRIQQDQEAFAALQEAVNLRPEDGDLLLFVADVHARFANYIEAEKFLSLAEGHSRGASWLRTAATLAGYQCDRKRALSMWREVLSLEPLALDAHRAVCGLLEETEGTASAVEFLENSCRQFPCHCGLLRLRATFLHQEHTGDPREALLALLDVNPADAWAHRELATFYINANQPEKALVHTEQGIVLDPCHPSSYCVRGSLYARQHQHAEAKADFRRAIELAVDTPYAMEKYLECCSNLSERQQALQFIESELIKQVVFGDGLLAYRNIARGVLGPEVVLASLHEARKARPDLWATWSSVVNQLADMDRLDEALCFAADTNDRFPFLPKLWLDRARIHQLRNEIQEAIQAIDNALTINPGYSQASQYKAELLNNQQDFAGACMVMERACTHAPMDFINHGYHALSLWKMERKEEALEKIQHALRLSPGYDWAWNVLNSWAMEIGRPELPIEMAKDLVERRPGEARSWMVLADRLGARKDPECIVAADRALTLNPLNPDLHDLKARLLSNLDRFDEALACCEPAEFPQTPIILRMLKAWIEAQRGRLNIAVGLMEDALKDDPARYGGWEVLADWLVQLGDLDKASKAADQMTLLAPQNARPLAYAAYLRQQEQDMEGAVSRFRKAFMLDPSYEFAAMSLFDLLIVNDVAQAADVLAASRQHLQPAILLKCEVILAVKQNQRDAAWQHFESLCRTEKAEIGDLMIAADALGRIAKPGKILQKIKHLLQEENVNQYLGAIFIQRCYSSGNSLSRSTIETLIHRGELGKQTLLTWINCLGEQHQKGGSFNQWKIRRSFFQVFNKNLDLFKNDDELWGRAGYMLTTLGRYHETAQWLKDWPERKTVQAWMLYNLAISFVITHRPQEALHTIRQALSQRQDANMLSSFAVLGAFEEAMKGNCNGAQQLLEFSQTSKTLSTNDKILIGFTKAVLLAHQETTGSRMQHVEKIRSLLISGLGNIHPNLYHKLVKICYKRCVQFLKIKLKVWNIISFDTWSVSIGKVVISIFACLFVIGILVYSFNSGVRFSFGPIVLGILIALYGSRKG